MTKYNILVNILDKIRNEAPLEFKSFHIEDENIEQLNNARSKALIHLYLKVKFGQLDFTERHKFVTDEGNDGGIDGYFIDKESKTIFFIQSKFRTVQENFENKNISYAEFFKMDVHRIYDGKPFDKDENGTKYNSKILNLIKEIKSLEDPAYKPHIIILANYDNKHIENLNNLFKGFSVEIFDYNRCYNELVFPVSAGTYYNPKEFKFQLQISETGSNEVSYYTNTELQECEIKLLFIPTIEIAKMMSKYKNSILKFNPRSFLGLQHNSVNTAIENSILKKTHNEFALFNNGITIVSSETEYRKLAGQRGKAGLTVTNPQIINGGQTAYSLNRIYEDRIAKNESLDVFENKEVLVKIITFTSSNDQNKKFDLIAEISKTTNQQTPINEADRVANDPLFIKMQKKIYENNGLFFERKRGEFYDGLQNGYIDSKLIIQREIFFRIAYACIGQPAQSRTISTQKIFTTKYRNFIKDENKYQLYVFGYKCFNELSKIQEEIKTTGDKYEEQKYGNALRFGTYAVISATIQKFYSKDIGNKADFDMKNALNIILLDWSKFENDILKIAHNRKYFKEVISNGEKIVHTNFNGYYRGTTLNGDIYKYFKNSDKNE